MAKFTRDDRAACRFMHYPATEKDFDPPAILDMNSITRRYRAGRKETCGRFALSFFKSVEAARTRFQSLSDREDAASRYGDHIGVLGLMRSDGLMSPTNQVTGHIDLHQEANVLFSDRIAEYYEADESSEDGNAS